MLRPLACLLACLLALACAPAGVGTEALSLDTDDTGGTGDTAAAGWRPVDHPDGPAFAWGEAVSVVLRSGDVGDWTMGLGIERRGEPVASWAPRPWMGAPGWIPLVPAAPRADGTPPLLATEGDTLALALAGSTEHGCPADELVAALHVDPDSLALDIAIQGVPYLALPPGGVRVEHAGGRDRVFPHPGSDWQGAGVAALAGPQGVRVDLDPPPPWLQLQGAAGFTEVDLDHGCEVDGWERTRLWVSVPPPD